MLTTRDIASLIWIAIGAIFLLVISSRRQVPRESWGELWRAATAWKVLVTFGSLFLWVGVCVAIGHAIVLGGLGALWGWELAKDTVWIVVLLAIPMLFRITKADSIASIAWPLIRESLGISALLVFYINLEPYSLLMELILQPVVTVLAVCSAKLKSRISQRIVNASLSLVLVATVIWVSVRLAHDARTLDWSGVTKEFLLSVWLPILLFPFLWLAAFLMAFESAVDRLRSYTRPQTPAVAFAVFLGLRFRISLADRLTFTDQALVNARSFGVAHRGMKEFRASDRLDQKVQRDRQRNLKKFVGAAGADMSGARLDRREFEASKRALDWLSALEEGQFNRDGKYPSLVPDDLLQVNNFGLEPPYGLELQVSPDRSRWRAWRSTVTGWVLGQGGHASSSEWYFAGSAAPTTWPGDSGTEWVNRPEDADLILGPPDWIVRDGTEDLG